MRFSSKFRHQYDIEKISTGDLITARRLVFNNVSGSDITLNAIALLVVLGLLQGQSPYEAMWAQLLHYLLIFVSGFYLLGTCINFCAYVWPLAKDLDSETLRRLCILESKFRTEDDDAITWDLESDRKLLQWIEEIEQRHGA